VPWLIWRKERAFLIQGSYSFHDFFSVFYDLKFSCHFENCQNHPCFRVFSDIICMFFILPYFGTCNNLRTTHITTSHDFPWPTIIFHDFPGLETEILKFHDFSGFPWPVRTLFISHDNSKITLLAFNRGTCNWKSTFEKLARALASLARLSKKVISILGLGVPILP